MFQLLKSAQFFLKEHGKCVKNEKKVAIRLTSPRKQVRERVKEGKESSGYYRQRLR